MDRPFSLQKIGGKSMNTLIKVLIVTLLVIVSVPASAPALARDNTSGEEETAIKEANIGFVIGANDPFRGLIEPEGALVGTFVDAVIGKFSIFAMTTISTENNLSPDGQVLTKSGEPGTFAFNIGYSVFSFKGIDTRVGYEHLSFPVFDISSAKAVYASFDKETSVVNTSLLVLYNFNAESGINIVSGANIELTVGRDIGPISLTGIFGVNRKYLIVENGTYGQLGFAYVLPMPISSEVEISPFMSYSLASDSTNFFKGFNYGLAVVYVFD